MTSVYIHIPFCERICTYCDFPKRVGTEKQMDDYLIAMEKEIVAYDVKRSLNSLYIGGGTPSILSGTRLMKLQEILTNFKFNENYEFTIECNPEHITVELLEVYKKMGVNRISLGVQTFNERLLKLLNRNHTKEIVLNAVELIKQMGITNISVDLIFSLPMQSKQNLIDDLEEIKQLGIKHVSCYSLILEEKTVLSKLIRENKLKLLENEVEAEMYQMVIDYLKGVGFTHYEISNFCIDGYASNHNQVYWKNQEYYGFGMGASGYLDGVRYDNTRLVTNYINQISQGQTVIDTKESLTVDTKIKESMLLGLRLLAGVSIDEVNRMFSIDVLDYFADEFNYLKKKNWIVIDDTIRLTHSGLYYGNEVFGMFI